MADSAWIGVIGALGGVGLTGAIGLGTAALTRRWTEKDRIRDRAEATDALRREAYVRYLVASESLGNSMFAAFLDQDWREQHGPRGSYQLFFAWREMDSSKADELDAAKNSAQLVASDSVRGAIDGPLPGTHTSGRLPS